MIRDPQEIREALATKDDVTVYFRGSQHQFMAFLHPFMELYTFRKKLDYRTSIRSSTFNTDQPLSLLLPRSARLNSTDATEVLIEANGECESYLSDFRSQLHTPIKTHRSTIFPLESPASISQTMAARRNQPWVPYTPESMPARILLMPPSIGNTVESIYGSFPLYRELCSNLLLSINKLNGQPMAIDDQQGFFFNFSSSLLFIDKTIFSIATTNLEGLVMAILSSTLVVAMESPFALLASMLSVPTLTIYGRDLRMQQYKLADKSLPTYAFSIDDVSKATPTYVHSKLHQIVSNLHSLR